MHSGENEIIEVGNGLRMRYKSISPLKETGDFGDSYFYGFCDDFDENKGRGQLEIEEEMKGRREVIETSDEYTEDWEEAQIIYETLKGD